MQTIFCNQLQVSVSYKYAGRADIYEKNKNFRSMNGSMNTQMRRILELLFSSVNGDDCQVPLQSCPDVFWEWHSVAVLISKITGQKPQGSINA